MITGTLASAASALDLYLATVGPEHPETSDAIGSLYGPEALMTVSFAGLNEAEQRRALESFPGGRRCSIAQQQR